MKTGYLTLMIAFVWGCSRPDTAEKKLPEGVGIILSNRDTTISATADLFSYVNGGWVKRISIPPDRGSWSSFSELADHNNEFIREILDKAADSKEFIEGTDQRKVIDFYRVGMDSLSIERSAINPLKPTLQKIAAIGSKLDLQNFLIEDDAYDGDAFFRFSVSPDMKNSQKMAAYLKAGGIGLPERDFYFKTDVKSMETRERYLRHILTMLKLSGLDELKAKRSAERILSVETELARATLSKEDRRDPLKLYNKISTADLSTFIPSINWKNYFTAMGVKEDSVIVTETAFLKGYERIVNTFGLDDIKDYLRWTAMRQSAPYLSYSFVRESFDFNSGFLLGAKQMRPRWKRVLAVSEQYLGEAIGKLYVAEVFPPEAKVKAGEMVENIKFAFADRIKNLDWMSDSTKQKALTKLSTFTVKIGFPDKWKNYNGLIVQRKQDTALYYTNILNASRFQVKEQIGRLGQPVDKTVWDMTPQTVNASYNPQFNEIVFPAGILQPPFYDYRADEAVNYGGIGAAIGHEITHGFDDEGSRYDAAGNLKNWWTAEDLRKFKEKGKALAGQFDRYQPLPGLFVQGQFTLGENLGDLGGLNAAYDGLQRFFREHNLKPEKIDGLAPEQRFFMSWATIWRAKYRDEALRNQVLTNEHSPGMYRANGPPSNMPEFYKAFGVKPGDKMYRDEKDRVRIW